MRRPPKRPRLLPESPPAIEAELAIERMGQLGEGVAEFGGRPVFIPYVLPGERVEARVSGGRGSPGAILSSSPERIAPFCPYFGRCGGCALQHWDEGAYRAWKRSLVVSALHFEALDPPVAEVIDAHGEGRRRVKLHVRRGEGGKGERKARAGFMIAKTHELVDIELCPILVPALREAPAIARLLGEVLASSGKPLGVQLTATRTGLDVDLTGNGPIDLGTRLRLTDLAARLDLARLSLHGDVVVERRAPMLSFGPVDVALPPGGFLQATEAGESALSALVLEAAQGARSIADLFSGAGPFALRLAGSARVHAADSDAAGIAALKRAGNHARGLKPLTTEIRDLFRRPLLVAELKSFEAVIFDPPRAGAEAQVQQLAASKVPTLIAVSCNPASFARDAGILCRAGYRLESVTPVDQFKWSAHLELVGVFRR